VEWQHQILYFYVFLFLCYEPATVSINLYIERIKIYQIIFAKVHPIASPAKFCYQS